MLGFVFPSVGPWELILILAILLIIVGPGKLPGVGKAIGKSIGEFRKAKSGDIEELEEKKTDN